MEQESFPHMLHEHPLSLIPDPAKQGDYDPYCSGCWRFILPGDATYGCSLRCGFERLLHKECMEMLQEIMHPIHPSHLLTLYESYTIFGSKECAVCEEKVYGLGYRCSQGGCDGLRIHLGCAGFLTDKQPLMYHPSHPQHQLRFSKKTRWCPFPCDACGATEKGDSYTCTLCDYSIHESCALLPESKDFPHHHHSLSLTYSLPSEYIKYEFDCGICSMTLPLRRWLYHCHLCRYIVHLNCATSTFDDENAIDGEKDVTKFPIAVDDMYEEIIRPFVRRESGKVLIPHDDQNIGGKYRFFSHPDHLLTFTTFASSSSSSSSHDHYKRDEDDEDDFESVPRWELICDGCTLPIHEKKQTDGDGYEIGYMSCDECKYFLHLSCFNLPLEISSLPIHPIKDHSLRLQNIDGKLTHWKKCNICGAYTIGLYYSCTHEGCSFNLDIKCSSLPSTITHTAHPRHIYLEIVTSDYESFFCVNCYNFVGPTVGQYKCNSCRFSVCGACVMLPATNKHRLENHMLWLTYDARFNHPGEFYCSSCEQQMDPRSWMYYCRDCDQSFHPECFPATSGEYRNIKYGTKQYVISIHDHPIRFQIISNKKRCDQCHEDSYDRPGFQCASCFFVVGVECGVKCLGDA
ncbi:uncharacterized protein LOC125218984 isoform X1 [Salvia hispanica]|uniref:uncharacterized protein LOC125218984 isoform X1 n=1 Tax=Salvia hispanica TaxID=49212 RepID=UPI00200925CF|nr:uncharacterized protein LOC125218984 isoform X1 [Salvia hispanica]